MRGLLVHALAVIAGAVLAACGIAQQIPQGASRDDVIARMGPPTRAVALPSGGERLQYSFQPAGQVAWMVDLDAAGRVTRVRQVLADTEFERIVAGVWTRADVEREFGPPGAWDDRVMTYRWRNVHGGDMFFWVYVDRQGIVRAVRQGSELPGNLTDL